MLRLSMVIVALTLLASITIDASPAQAVVCSQDICVSHCFRGGVRHCLRGCDRRIARRQTNGLCPWSGLGWSLGQ
jgi:hypothetical protein